MTSPTRAAEPADSQVEPYRPGPIRIILLAIGLLCVLSLAIDAARDGRHLQLVILLIPAGVLTWALIPSRPHRR